MVRLFSYSCKAKEVKNYLKKHQLVFDFLLQEYSKGLSDTMNSCAERGEGKCMQKQEKKLASA